MRAFAPDELQLFVTHYSPADLGWIAYDAKAGVLRDENLELRQQLIGYVLAELDGGRQVPLLLLRDLFVQDSLCARDAFGVARNYHLLAQAFLAAADGSLIDDFLLGCSASFDTLLSCGRVRLPAAKLGEYLHGLDALISAAPDRDSRERYQAARAFFAGLRPSDAASS